MIKQEKGFSLIEVAIAMLLLGIVAVAFFGALATGAKALLIADERTTAESLARSQMEYVKNQEYIDYSDPDRVDDYNTIGTPPSAPPGYDVELDVAPFDPDTGVPYDESGGVFVLDDGIQRITVTVEHHDKELIILEDYKVDR